LDEGALREGERGGTTGAGISLRTGVIGREVESLSPSPSLLLFAVERESETTSRTVDTGVESLTSTAAKS
jgi:hypothetical protein